MKPQGPEFYKLHKAFSSGSLLRLFKLRPWVFFGSSMGGSDFHIDLYRQTLLRNNQAETLKSLCVHVVLSSGALQILFKYCPFSHYWLIPLEIKIEILIFKVTYNIIFVLGLISKILSSKTSELRLLKFGPLLSLFKVCPRCHYWHCLWCDMFI